MNLFTNRLSRFAFSLGLSALLAVGATAPAFAQSSGDDTNVTVSGTTLSWTPPTVSDLSGISLSGANQTVSGSLSAFQVIDARGTGVGWNVTIEATQLKEYATGSYVVDGKTIAVGTMTVSQPSITPGTGSSAAPAQAADTGITKVIDNGSAQTIVSAVATTGMGTFDFGSAEVKVVIPANAYAVTYRSDVTITLSATP